MDTMIELPAMRRTAELAPNTADATARTVEVVWSAGARVRRATFFGDGNDPDSLVNELARQANSHRLLEHLGTKPSVIYLT